MNEEFSFHPGRLEDGVVPCDLCANVFCLIWLGVSTSSHPVPTCPVSLVVPFSSLYSTRTFEVTANAFERMAGVHGYSITSGDFLSCSVLLISLDAS